MSTIAWASLRAVGLGFALLVSFLAGMFIQHGLTMSVAGVELKKTSHEAIVVKIDRPGPIQNLSNKLSPLENPYPEPLSNYSRLHAEPVANRNFAQTQQDGRTKKVYISGRAATARLYTVEGQLPMSVLDLDPARLAPMTHEVQQLIHKSQNPDDCTTAQYMIMGGFNSGVGSNIHVFGAHAMHAMRTGRVILWSGDFGKMYTDNELCGGDRTWSCHLRWPSKCTIQHAQARAFPDTVDVSETANGLSQKAGEVKPAMPATEYFAPAVLDLFRKVIRISCISFACS